MSIWKFNRKSMWKLYRWCQKSKKYQNKEERKTVKTRPNDVLQDFYKYNKLFTKLWLKSTCFEDDTGSRINSYKGEKINYEWGGKSEK